jgi:hypothetical protein
MRPLVQPPPSLRCMCGGELRLKLIEPADRTFQTPQLKLKFARSMRWWLTCAFCWA